MVGDLIGMDLRGTWLAVASACETAFTDPRDITDDYQGLPAAFLVAGAQTLVASLWSVSDCSTALLMQRFHKNLYTDRMSKATALGEAQKWVRNLTYDEINKLFKSKRDALLVQTATGMSAPDLAEAFSAMKDHLRGDRPFANPHFWAAFQCIGAGWTPGESGDPIM